jgi:hypothetical protein
MNVIVFAARAETGPASTASTAAAMLAVPSQRGGGRDVVCGCSKGGRNI